ncbi:CGNR zinc finger domain-containing protein [Microbacterium sp. NPDC007973]|uniref:CGNR zinc finger domain-containing protein n=1 Tax=Microbacterium sp. NPDC007973 TaxID=3364182 RepID=UPI0036F10C65
MGVTVQEVMNTEKAVRKQGVQLVASPRGNRVWCTAAGCGNRNRVARHHARTKR